MMALDVYLHNHDRIFFELQLAKSLTACLSDSGFLPLSPAIHEKVHQLLALHTLRAPKSTPLLDSWPELCKTIAIQYTNLTPELGSIKASLELINSVLISEETASAPEAYKGGYYRIGTTVCEFLFDYLNLIAGFHPYNDKSRTDYPHVLIVIGEWLLRGVSKAAAAIDMRGASFELVGFSMHSTACKGEIYDDLAIEENIFTHIEWLGIETEAEVVTFLGHIFNQSQAEMISRTLGNNLNLLRTLTESIVNSPSPDFMRYLQLSTPEFSLEEGKFLRKINEVYLAGETQHVLARGDLDFALRHALRSFVKMQGEAYAVHMIGEEMKNTAIYKALMDVGILYPEKHAIYISFAPLGALHFAAHYLQSRPLRFSTKLDYWVYVVRDALKIRDLALNKTRKQSFYYKNPQIRWDTDLYDFHVGKRPDPVITGMPVDDPGRPAEIIYPRAPFITNELMRVIISPITMYLSIILNYPHKYLRKREENHRKGLEKRPPALWYHNYMDSEKHDFSLLPSWGEEVKLGMTKWEEGRTLLRGVYLAENPTKFAEQVKWRHVRRFLKDCKSTVKQHHFWQ